ncbi:MAG TPA: nuclear transport factor 2 family protein [Terriglobales bacterium]|nr:nuclear transport factor 2 family protein [Terriglobales bacterium]
MSNLTREEMDRIMNEHFAYEAQDDVDGVVSTLTEDVEHDIVGSPGSQVTGREAARKYYESLFANLKGESAQPVRRFYGDNFMIDETLWTGHVVGRVLGAPGGEGRVSFRILHLLEFRDGKISRENVWIDLASIMQQLGRAEATAA